MKYKCIIFDCDGVLVDSEVISNRILVEMANSVGAKIELKYALENFAGKSLKSVFEHIEKLIEKKREIIMAKLTRNVNYSNYRWEEYVLTEEELAQWKTGDEDLQQEIIDNADWDLVRDKPIDDYSEPEFVEE